MSTTTTHTEQQQNVIDRVERELLSGHTFALVAHSNRSAHLGGPAVAARGYGKVIEALGRFASNGNWHVAAAREAIVKANPYQTPNEVIAHVAEALAKFVRVGYYDVIGATGPEAGRPSAHQHEITLSQAITLRLLLTEVEEAVGYHGSVPGIGWALAALMERENMSVASAAFMFPLTAARAAKN